MASVDTRATNHFRKSFNVIEFSAVLLVLVSINGHLANDLTESEPWIPIARPDISSRNENNYHFNRRKNAQYNWRPSQEMVIKNYNLANENIKASLKPDDTSFSAPNIMTIISPQHTTESASLEQINQDSIAFNITLQEDPAHDSYKLLPIPSNNIRKPRFQKQVLDSPNHINKQHIGIKITNNNASTNEKKQPQIEKTHHRNTNFSNIRTNMYEVTESSITTNDLVTEETIAKESTGYSYEKPLLELTDKPIINTDNTNLTSNFWNILAKYKINVSDDLNNYELSREAVLSEQKNNIYLLPIPLSAYRVPSGHNIQRNYPMERLFALFLSNYGYYLPQFYRIHGGYRNLYGNLAYNNMHNNKPFGPYKLF